MSINSAAYKKIEELLDNYSNNKLSDIELVSELHSEAKGSSIIFSLLLEKLLAIAYDNGQIILSKTILKQYLQSKHKEFDDYAYIGGDASEETSIKSVHGISVYRGIFIKILEKLNFEETLNAYIKYLIIQADEINESKYLSKQDIEKYSGLNEIIEILFGEFNAKIDSNKRIINYNA